MVLAPNKSLFEFRVYVTTGREFDLDIVIYPVGYYLYVLLIYCMVIRAHRLHHFMEIVPDLISPLQILLSLFPLLLFLLDYQGFL